MNIFLQYITVVLLLLLMAEVAWLGRNKHRRQVGQISTLVDTSVLMDGRVIDLARTGFLLGQIIVPRSVLAELQLLADGSDHTKRERARMGMDVVKQLQDELGGSFVLLQDQQVVREGVDNRLIALAKQTNSSILTLDYNLNKVAQVEGVEVLNINELAKSLRMTHLPGDKLKIDLVQKGQSADQAVGYLDDGTMVVVEQAKRLIGQSHDIEIIRSLQTDAGKMMFAKLVKTDTPSSKPAGRSDKKDSTQRHTSPRAAANGKSIKRIPPQSQPKPVQAPKNQPRPRPQKSKRVDHEAELIRLADNQ